MKNRKKTVVIVSGYFNPLHIGHVKMIEEAKKLGDYLIVIVNNDTQVKLKKSVPFMDQIERTYIVSRLEDVSKVLISLDLDKTVCQSLKFIHNVFNYSGNTYNIIFANGGDRKSSKDIPETKLCRKLGIKMVFGVGGKKIQSSSKLISKAKKYGI